MDKYRQNQQLYYSPVPVGGAPAIPNRRAAGAAAPSQPDVDSNEINEI